MVRLYKKLREYGVAMMIEPDVVHEDYLYISFDKDARDSTARHIHLDLIRLVPDKAEDIIIKHLDEFIDSLK